VLIVLGKFDDAVAEVKRAVELDPLSVIINADLGNTLFSAHRYDEAIEQLRKTVEMEPNFYYARWNLGQALEMKGLIKEARAEYEKAIALDNDPVPLALLGHLYGGLGKTSEALNILERLRAMRKERYVSSYNFVLVHLGLGQTEEALTFLEKAYEERDGYNIAFIKADAFLDPLRGNPRFEKLVQKIFGGG
jgi:tetratricopeptide (TPR) repeat protein